MLKYVSTSVSFLVGNHFRLNRIGIATIALGSIHFRIPSKVKVVHIILVQQIGDREHVFLVNMLKSSEPYLCSNHNQLIISSPSFDFHCVQSINDQATSIS